MAPRPILPFIFALLLLDHACASDAVDGRYGRVELRYVEGKPAVFHRGAKALTFDEADEADILRVIPETSQDFVLIKSWKQGRKCHNRYRLLSIPGKETVLATPELSDCTEVAGITFAGSSPIIHLRQPDAPNVEQFIWKAGKLLGLAPATAACFQKHALAIDKSGRVPLQQSAQLAAGEGRLQFHSAPDEHCAIAGTFVVPGDRLEASRTQGRYTLVVYQNPKTEKAAAGWVESTRLKPAN